MSTSLLPPNATPLERALADTLPAGVSPEPIRALWSPDACPPAFLPFLAWAFSVDGWASALTVDQQRSLIRDSVALHRRKGTVWAVKRVFALLNLDASIAEWPTYSGDPFTFRVRVVIADRGISDTTLAALLQLIDAYKNARSHLDRLDVVLQLRGPVRFAVAGRIRPPCVAYPRTQPATTRNVASAVALTRLRPRLRILPRSTP